MWTILVIELNNSGEIHQNVSKIINLNLIINHCEVSKKSTTKFYENTNLYTLNSKSKKKNLRW